MTGNLRRAVILVSLISVLCSAGLGLVTVKVPNNCQGQYFKEIGGYQASPGMTYLVTKLEIQNTGSSDFYVDSSVFEAVVDNTSYQYSLATYSLGSIELNPLATTTIGDGASAEGYIAFEVPEGTEKLEVKYVGQEPDVSIECVS